MAVTTHQAEAVQKLAGIIVESVAEAGRTGIPGGTLYAALMTVGVTFDVYNALIDALVRAGKVRRSGDWVYAA